MHSINILQRNVKRSFLLASNQNSCGSLLDLTSRDASKSTSAVLPLGHLVALTSALNKVGYKTTHMPINWLQDTNNDMT